MKVDLYILTCSCVLKATLHFPFLIKSRKKWGKLRFFFSNGDFSKRVIDLPWTYKNNWDPCCSSGWQDLRPQIYILLLCMKIKKFSKVRFIKPYKYCIYLIFHKILQITTYCIKVYIWLQLKFNFQCTYFFPKIKCLTEVISIIPAHEQEMYYACAHCVDKQFKHVPTLLEHLKVRIYIFIDFVFNNFFKKFYVLWIFV